MFDDVNIIKARILKIKPIKPKISGRKVNIDVQFESERGSFNVSLIYKPDVEPRYIKASYIDSNASVSVLFIFHLILKKNYAYFLCSIKTRSKIYKR